MKFIKEHNPFKYKTLTQLCLFLTVISVCLGDFANIYGLKLSWIFAALSVAAFVYEYIIKRYPFTGRILHIKIAFGFFVFWLAYATVQMLMIDKNDHAFMFYRFLALNIFLILMLILNTKSLDDILFFNRALIIGCSVNLLIVIWELFTGKRAIDMPAEPGSVYGVFANMNDLCTLLAFGVFALILNMLLTKKNILISLAAIAFSVCIFMIDKSRAPLLGLLVLLFFWGLFEIALLLYQKSRRLFICYIAVLIAVPIIAAVIVLSRYSLAQLVSMLSNETTVKSDSERIQLTKKALEIIKDSNFLGVGPGQSVQRIGLNVHNFFLEILAEYGLFILSGIIYLFVVIFTAYKTKLANRISSLLMAFIPFFAVVTISSSSAARIKATWVMITLVFLAVNYGGKDKQKTAEASQQEEEL